VFLSEFLNEGFRNHLIDNRHLFIMAKTSQPPRRGPKIRIASYVPVVTAMLWHGYSERYARELFSEDKMYLPNWLWRECCLFLAEQDNSDGAVEKFINEIREIILTARAPRQAQDVAELEDLDADLAE
jgi:hypothetical protein